MRAQVGDVVLYRSYGTPGGEYEPEHRAAIVTAVSGTGDGIVGLAVLNPTGMFFNAYVPFSEAGEPGHWTWRD